MTQHRRMDYTGACLQKALAQGWWIIKLVAWLGREATVCYPQWRRKNLRKGERPKARPCCSGRNTGPSGGAAADRKWGEERQCCLLKGAVFVLWLIKKQEEGDLSHVHVSFQAEFKVIPLAQVEKILSPINPNIPAEGTLLSQKWPGNRWEENARYKHLCYRWGGPRMRRRWRKKLLKASPAFFFFFL